MKARPLSRKHPVWGLKRESMFSDVIWESRVKVRWVPLLPCEKVVDFGIIVPKRLGKSCQRKRFKRQFRHVLYQVAAISPISLGLIFLIRENSIFRLSFQELLQGVQGFLGRVFSRLQGAQSARQNQEILCRIEKIF